MNMETLLREMRSDENDEAGSMTDVQIIGRLQSICSLRSEKHSFERGQILRHKFPKLANCHTGKAPAIFIRYLAKPCITADHPEAFEDVTDWSSTATSRVLDCVIGAIVKGTYNEFLVESEDYVQATEADYGPIANITE